MYALVLVAFLVCALLAFVAGVLTGIALTAKNEPDVAAGIKDLPQDAWEPREFYELPPRPTSEFDGFGQHGHNPGASIYKARPGL